jgi:hypothetical protein
VRADLQSFISDADGTSIVITATKVGASDDLANVGAIKATNIALGRVAIDGDLGQIDCGRAKVPVGLKSLVVNSIYKLGATTQIAGTPAADALESRITGELSTLRVKTDFHGYIHTVDGTSFVGGELKTTAPAKITNVTIKGSIIGNGTVATASNNTGLIESDRTIGTVRVLGVGENAGVIGGGGSNSGTILADTAIGSVSIADSIVGGGGANSGAVIAKRKLGTITVGEDLVGGMGVASGTIQARLLETATIGDAAGDDILGGAGADSGAITVERNAGSINIAGSILGGAGENSGGVSAGSLTSIVVNGDLTGAGPFHSGYIESLGNIGTARVLGTVTGGAGDRSGTIMASGSITRTVVGEKLIGGEGNNSGSIFSGLDTSTPGNLTSLLVKQGIQGGEGISSGAVVAGTIGTARIGTAGQGADIVGGAGDFSGSVISQGGVASLTLFGSLQGGEGDQSGSVQSHGVLKLANISGSVLGAGGILSGSIVANDRLNQDDDIVGKGNVGTVFIGGDITGGGGERSGRIEAAGNIASITATALEGGAGSLSGSIAAGLVPNTTGGVRGNLASLTLNGAMTSTNDGADPTIIAAGTIGSISIAGVVTDGIIRAGQEITSLVFNDDITGTTISAVGQASPVLPTGDLAIARILVRGNVASSQVLAGYDIDGTPVNADASIGKVRVMGTWSASDIVAGVIDGGSNGFGTPEDTKIVTGTDRSGFVSQIRTVNITGAITGTEAAGDHFGFVAQRILKLKNGSTSLAFNLAAGDQFFEITPTTTNDVTAREVAI